MYHTTNVHKIKQMKNSNLNELIATSEKTDYLDQTCFVFDNNDFGLDATLKDGELSYIIYEGEEKIELTDRQEIILHKAMESFKQDQTSNAFTQDDFIHFNSLIHS